MSAATPAPIWWCAEDNRSGDENCHAGWHEACGPRLLVDPLALVVERDAEGNWPAELVDPDGPLWFFCGGDGPDLLDNLAAWARREAST